MKYLLIFSLTILVACNASDKKTAEAENTNRDSLSQVAMQDSSNYTSIQWIDSVNQNLGNVQEGQVVDITWKFKNAGNKPLVIADVAAGCGCTVAEKPNEPIAPGGEEIIKARFDSKGQSAGINRKQVTVRANTSEQVYYLNFTVNVAPKS
jgi:hypothetical protein